MKLWLIEASNLMVDDLIQKWVLFRRNILWQEMSMTVQIMMIIYINSYNINAGVSLIGNCIAVVSYVT